MSTTIQAGYEVPDYSKMKDAGIAPVNPTAPDKVPKKKVYPDITLRGDAADQIMSMLEPDDTFVAEVVFKLIRTEKRKGGKKERESEEEANRCTCDIEIHSIEIETDKTGKVENEADETAEDAVDAYRASKGSGGAGEGDEEED